MPCNCNKTGGSWEVTYRDGQKETFSTKTEAVAAAVKSGGTYRRV